jgi:hypothetical protein
MIRPSFSGQQPERMLSDQTPVLYREVRRKPDDEGAGEFGHGLPPIDEVTLDG